MKSEILIHLNDPGQLEKLYHKDKAAFKRTFNLLYPGLKDHMLADYWHERLNYAGGEISWGSRKDFLVVLIASVLAGLIAKLPALSGIDETFFYTRNISFTVFPLLTAYFAWKHQLPRGRIIFITGVMLLSLLFINFLPDVKSDTLLLSCMHLPVVLWSLLGLAFAGEAGKSTEKRLDFLAYNGNLAVMTIFMGIAGAMLTGLTIGLFSLIGFHIEKFYFEHIIIFVLPAIPIAGTHLIRINPQLVGKISPVIAKIFSPLVLSMLVIYLAAIVSSGKNPYNDREFLLMFNFLLIGVMIIIFFSVTEIDKTAKSHAGIWVLFLLSVVTIVVNGIALSAIVFRISAWGITPNRAAVLGSNVLILINLLLVTVQLFRVLSQKTGLAGVGNTIAAFLPVYSVWAVMVTFIFPLLFAFK